MSFLSETAVATAAAVAAAGQGDIESRIQAVERKNRMLEKMLIAVIRGTVGQDLRQAELQRATSLDDLLKELRLVDAGPASPILPARSTQSPI